jgi:hypothetical protein
MPKKQMPKTNAKNKNALKTNASAYPSFVCFIVLETINRVKSCFCVSKHSIVRIQCGHATCDVFARVCLETSTQLKQKARDQET